MSMNSQIDIKVNLEDIQNKPKDRKKYLREIDDNPKTPINLQEYQYLSYRLSDPDLVDLPKINFDDLTTGDEIPDPIPREKKLIWDLVMRDVLSPWGVRSREKLKQKLQNYNISEILGVPSNKSLFNKSTSLTHFLKKVSFANNDEKNSVLTPNRLFTVRQKAVMRPIPSLNPGNLGLSNLENHADKLRRHQSFECTVKSLWDILAEDDARQDDVRQKAAAVIEKLGGSPSIKFKNDELDQEFIRRKSCSSYNWSGGISKFELKTMHIPFTVNRNLAKSTELSKSIQGVFQSNFSILKKNDSRGPAYLKASPNQNRPNQRDSIRKITDKSLQSKKTPHIDMQSSSTNIQGEEQQSDHRANVGSRNSLASIDGKFRAIQQGDWSAGSSKIFQDSPKNVNKSAKLGPNHSPASQKDERNRYFFGKGQNNLELKLFQEKSEESVRPPSRLQSKPQSPKVINTIRSHLHDISLPHSSLNNSFEQSAEDVEKNERQHQEIYRQQSRFADEKQEKRLSRANSLQKNEQIKLKNESPGPNPNQIKLKPVKISTIKMPEKNQPLMASKNQHIISRSTNVSPKRVQTTSAKKLTSVRVLNKNIELEAKKTKKASNKSSVEISATPKQLSIDIVSPKTVTGGFLFKDMSPYTQKTSIVTTTHKFFSRKSSLPSITPQKTADNFTEIISPKIGKERSDIDIEAKMLLGKINSTNLGELLKESNRNILKRSTFNHVNNLVGAFQSSILNFEKTKKERLDRRIKAKNNKDKEVPKV